MQGIDSDLIRGHIDTIILKVLSDGDKYGFEICKEVDEKSGGLYELKQPTLYSCLKRLEGQKLISSYWEDSDLGGKRHYYKLTALGKETYQKNQKDWNRSRQIIDNLIDADTTPLFFPAEKNENNQDQQIKNLEEEIENLKTQLKEKEENPTIIYKEKTSDTEHHSYLNDDKIEFTNSNLNIDDEEIIPWENSQTQNTSILEPEIKTAQIQENGENLNVEYAPNGEILSFEKSEEQENQEDIDENASFISEEEQDLEKELSEEDSPAQASVFDDEEQVFDEDSTPSEVDIMELLGHTSKKQVEYQENKDDKINNLPAQIEQEPEEDVKPFNFRMDDFVVKSKESYFESDEDLSSSYQYLVPEEKIEGLTQENQASEPFDFEKFKKDKLGNQEEFDKSDINVNDKSDVQEDAQPVNTEDEIYQTPVYHSFEEVKDPKETYENLYSQNTENNDDIYQSPIQEESDRNYENNSEFRIFDDILEENEQKQNSDQLVTYVNDIDNSTENNSYSHLNNNQDAEKMTTQDVIDNKNAQNNDFMDFYKSTNNYNNLHPAFTEEEYKSKLSSLMTYSTSQNTDENTSSDFEYKQLTAPKDFSELKINFEREGIKVKPHTKVVKESKNSRSYVESNKLNFINSWTAYGVVSFFTLLAFLIMHAYGSVSPNIFLIGIGCLAIVPATYTVIYFINPYKKKPAKYASRVYMLFAILITIQLLIITYCINLQLGFYSFSQENYEHLYWIVPTLLSIYPLADAILHNVYFYSKNFHV